MLLAREEVADMHANFIHTGAGDMNSRKTVVAALIALTAIAACAKGENETADTTTIPGVDTTAGLAVPVTDTIVKTTKVDTLQGEAKRGDTTKAAKKSPY